MIVDGWIDTVKASPSGAITFLNCGQKMPHHFSAIIRDENMAPIAEALGGPPADVLVGRTVRVTGSLYYTKDTPNIEIRVPGQIEIVRQP